MNFNIQFHFFLSLSFLFISLFVFQLCLLQCIIDAMIKCYVDVENGIESVETECETWNKCIVYDVCDS